MYLGVLEVCRGKRKKINTLQTHADMSVSPYVRIWMHLQFIFAVTLKKEKTIN